jgi:hypothetical protein
MPTSVAAQSVKPFGVQIDTPRNSDVMLQGIDGGCRLRGAIAASKTVKDAKTGEEKLPRDASRHLGALPAIPGMEIHVNPAKRTYSIVDPLHGNTVLCELISRALREDGRPFAGEIRGVEPRNGELDVDRMKTLCRELVWLLKSDHAKMIKGIRPDLDDIEDLPGKYLLNPGSRVANMQPRYEEDFSEWVQNLARTGG